VKQSRGSVTAALVSFPVQPKLSLVRLLGAWMVKSVKLLFLALLSSLVAILCRIGAAA
jgi:hypothetical protein